MSPVPAAPGFVGATLEAARQTLLRMRYRRSWRLQAIVAILLAVIAWVLAGQTRHDAFGRQLYCVVAWWFLGTVLMPWTTFYLAVQAVHGPLEDRSFQYLFVRPIGRVPLLLGSWLAVACAGAAIAAVNALALFAGVAMHERHWPDGIEWHLCAVFAEAYAYAAVAYAAAAVLFSATFRRPLVWGVFFVVGLQMLTANLPVSAGLRRLTITDPVRRLVLDGVEPNAILAQDLWPAEQAVRSELIGEPLVDLAWFTGVCLLFAAWTYSRTEYEARDRE